ncbi:unnamed protein product [Dicrocoelium dendriticum]|nr:unnamed protein product [Dicrocoelium dendriticum]
MPVNRRTLVSRPKQIRKLSLDCNQNAGGAMVKADQCNILGIFNGCQRHANCRSHLNIPLNPLVSWYFRKRFVFVFLMYNFYRLTARKY